MAQPNPALLGTKGAFIADVLRQMTLNEKIGQLRLISFGPLMSAPQLGELPRDARIALHQKAPSRSHPPPVCSEYAQAARKRRITRSAQPGATMNLIRAVACGFAPFVLAACVVTHETSVLVGTPRAPTTPEQVRLYSSPPKKYTEIALVFSDAVYDLPVTQAWLDTAVLNTKNEAAKIGANGILLNRLGDFRARGSSFFLVQPSLGRDELVSGKAIYVTEE